MTGKILSRWVRCAIIAIALCGIVICAFWVPMGLGGIGKDDVTWKAMQSAELWVQSVFHWVVSLPCFWGLTVAWYITIDMKNDKLFTTENSLRVKRFAQVLFFDILLFLAGNIVFAALKWHRLIAVYCFAAVVGLVLVALLAVLSHYLFRAAELQEESEGTI